MMVMRSVAGAGGGMMARDRHRRIDGMSRMARAERSARVAGKRRPNDDESESKRQQAPNHQNLSIPNQYLNGRDHS